MSKEERELPIRSAADKRAFKHLIDHVGKKFAENECRYNGNQQFEIKLPFSEIGEFFPV